MAETKRLNLKVNFAWALAANVIFNLSQFLILCLLTKFLPADSVGRYSFAVALCTPYTTLSSLKLGVIHVTDKKNRFAVGDLLGVQIVLSVASMLLIAVTALFLPNTTSSLPLVLLVGLGQAITLIRDVVLSLNQKYERMDTVAKSKALTAGLTLTLFTTVVVMTRDLLFAAATLLLSRVFVFLIWDIPQSSSVARTRTEPIENRRGGFAPLFNTKQMSRILALGFPMCLASFIQSMYVNLPKFYISYYLGAASLGFFSAILAVSMVGKLVIQAATSSVLPRLTQYYEDDITAFKTLLARLTLVGSVMGFAGVLLSLPFGGLLLRLAFSQEYADYGPTLTLCMVFIGVAYIGTFMTYANAAMGNFRIQPISNLLALSVVAILSPFLIPPYGLNGAATALIAAVTLQTFALTLAAWNGARNRCKAIDVVGVPLPEIGGS